MGGMFSVWVSCKRRSEHMIYIEELAKVITEFAAANKAAESWYVNNPDTSAIGNQILRDIAIRRQAALAAVYAMSGRLSANPSSYDQAAE